MSEKIKKQDLKGAMKHLKREHPTLSERLGQYRDKRTSYEAKRLARSATASTPFRQGARRELRG